MKVAVGFDPREQDGFDVTVSSIKKYNPLIDVRGIYKPVCEASGLYTRPTALHNGKLYDLISKAPMATEFSLTRFLVPWLFKKEGWVLFMDCDMLVTCDLEEILKVADPEYAVMCVKHKVEHGTGVKMDGCQQTSYERKNWSSVMLWNLSHPANDKLTLKAVNTENGKALHQLNWLKDSEIGELPVEWNHLVGLLPENKNAKIVHYTLGIPSMAGYETCEYSAEWREQFNEINSHK